MERSGHCLATRQPACLPACRPESSVIGCLLGRLLAFAPHSKGRVFRKWLATRLGDCSFHGKWVVTRPTEPRTSSDPLPNPPDVASGKLQPFLCRDPGRKCCAMERSCFCAFCTCPRHAKCALERCVHVSTWQATSRNTTKLSSQPTHCQHVISRLIFPAFLFEKSLPLDSQSSHRSWTDHVSHNQNRFGNRRVIHWDHPLAIHPGGFSGLDHWNTQVAPNWWIDWWFRFGIEPAVGIEGKREATATIGCMTHVTSQALPRRRRWQQCASCFKAAPRICCLSPQSIGLCQGCGWCTHMACFEMLAPQKPQGIGFPCGFH